MNWLGAITRPPGFVVYLLPAGVAVGILLSRLFGEALSVGNAVFTIIGAMVFVRAGGFILRRILPVSKSVRNEWTHARTLGKRFDSFQWQKLLWIGAGLLLSSVIPLPGPVALRVACGAVCVFLGAIATFIWRRAAVENRALILSWKE